MIPHPNVIEARRRFGDEAFTGIVQRAARRMADAAREPGRDETMVWAYRYLHRGGELTGRELDAFTAALAEALEPERCNWCGGLAACGCGN